MKIGIIAEFNPFHKGHEYLIKKAGENGDTVICALSGNFVQRGDTAVFSKQQRCRFALSAGADIVVEIPVLWSMSTAQNFALCGVWQLYNMNCEKIIFGSESGDINALIRTADILLGDGFFALCSKYLKEGITFAAARERAAEELGADKNLLKNPNDNLGIEYIVAAKRLKLNIAFDCVKRQGALHSGAPLGDYASGEYIRGLLRSGKFSEAKRFLPDYVCFEQGDISDISLLERTILGILRTKSESDFKNLPDLSEGIENRLADAVKTAKSLDELCEKIKTKRYTLARVRRLILSAALGFDKKFFMAPPPYTRILGASSAGIEALKSIVTVSPAVSRAADIEKLGDDCKAVFKAECAATDLYALSFGNAKEAGGEYTFKFIK